MNKKLLPFIILISAAVLFVGGMGIYYYFGEKQPEDEFSPVLYMLPENTIYVDNGEKLQLTVCAKDKSKLSVKLGTKEYYAEKAVELPDDYSLYYIDCVFPSNKEEIDSIGFVKVVCDFEGELYSFQGAGVVFEEKNEATTADFTTQLANSESSTESFSEDYSADEEEYILDKDYVEPAVTSGQMCVITADRADTWPGDTTDDILNPSFTALTKGTMAYVSGTCSAYDAEKKETRYFYNLTCGRRILQNDAVLVDEKKSDSEIKSSIGFSGGKTMLSVSSSWPVPYSFSAAPLSYYEGSGRLFNVNEFMPTEISFTFFHTVKATGTIDFSESDIFKSGKWSVDENSKTATLSIKLRSPGSFYGFSAEYSSTGDLMISFNQKPSSIKGSVIVLDPGHGGKDSGALGYYGQVKESDINFAETVELKNILESRGATVYMTRYTDEYFTLNQRREFAFKYKPDVFVSVHSNSSPDKSASGTSVYYYKPMSINLADNVYDSLVDTYSTNIYTSNTQKLSQIKKGCNYKPFAVTRVDDCPSVLIELGFVSNDEECAKLCDSTVRQTLARAIADGIEKSLM